MNVVMYSVTMAIWESWEGINFNAANNTLTIVTRDDITYVFDITTGEIIYDTARDTPFIPYPEDSWEYDINNGELPLWARESVRRASGLDILPDSYDTDPEETPREPNLSTTQTQTWRRPLIWGLLPASAIIALIIILRLRANKRR